ncbi:MAG TPA: PrsW family glutamic-type intramembrane protease [Prolixibacteraceae bacterium]|nr:PrsW family glutamic-type intramembrane protease [Prolixibacteraceae bacterium]
MNGLIILALAPVFILAFYIYFRDKYEKEPWGLLLLALFAGAFITLPVIYAEEFVSFFGRGFSGILKGAWHAFMVAALCEEAFKFLALYLIVWKSKEFNEKFDGIVYATFISLGFAAVENVLYVTGSGLNTGLVRAFTAVPAHALFGVSMGYFFGMAKFYPAQRKKYIRWAFLLPFFLHGVYDFILMAGINYLLLAFIPFIVYLWVTGFKRMKKLNEASFYRNDLDLGIDFRKVNDYDPDRTSETTEAP